MEEKNTGGRPSNARVKLILKNVMKELGVADVNLARTRYTAFTGQNANYHTIKKYLDQLVDEDFLRVQVVQDNIQKVEKKQSQLRRRAFLYQVNQIFHTADKMVNSP